VAQTKDDNEDYEKHRAEDDRNGQASRKSFEDIYQHTFVLLRVTLLPLNKPSCLSPFGIQGIFQAPWTLASLATAAAPALCASETSHQPVQHVHGWLHREHNEGRQHEGHDDDLQMVEERMDACQRDYN